MYDQPGVVCLIEQERDVTSDQFRFKVHAVGSNVVDLESKLARPLQTCRSTTFIRQSDYVSFKSSYYGDVNNSLLDLMSGHISIKQYFFRIKTSSFEFFARLFDTNFVEFVFGLAEDYTAISFICEDLEIPWENLYLGQVPDGYFLYEKALITRDVSNSQKSVRSPLKEAVRYEKQMKTVLCESIIDLPCFDGTGVQGIEDVINSSGGSSINIVDVASDVTDIIEDFRNIRTNIFITHGSDIEVQLGGQKHPFGRVASWPHGKYSVLIWLFCNIAGAKQNPEDLVATDTSRSLGHACVADNDMSVVFPAMIMDAEWAVRLIEFLTTSLNTKISRGADEYLVREFFYDLKGYLLEGQLDGDEKWVAMIPWLVMYGDFCEVIWSEE